jgi:hypothetical protein
MKTSAKQIIEDSMHSEHSFLTCAILGTLDSDYTFRKFYYHDWKQRFFENLSDSDKMKIVAEYEPTN